MPRTEQEILDHGDEMAARFEMYEPQPGDGPDPDALAALRSAALVRAEAEGALRDAVVRARGQHHSWQAIGALLGNSGEAVRQRYRPKQDG